MAAPASCWPLQLAQSKWLLVRKSHHSGVQGTHDTTSCTPHSSRPSWHICTSATYDRISSQASPGLRRVRSSLPATSRHMSCGWPMKCIKPGKPLPAIHATAIHATRSQTGDTPALQPTPCLPLSRETLLPKFTWNTGKVTSWRFQRTTSPPPPAAAPPATSASSSAAGSPAGKAAC